MQNVVGMHHQLECNILMVEYRGYGLSQGSPSEEGLSMDAQSALDFLSSRADINHKEIIVFGRSLGINCFITYFYRLVLLCINASAVDP